MEKFSVLMSVYYKEKSEFLDLALKSILVEQTIIPNEIILVEDGPLTEKLDKVIEKYHNMFPDTLKLLILDKNMGLGNALKLGLEKCSNEIIMRMDSDDISVKDRFEKQLSYMKNHPDIAVVGGYIGEFEQDYVNENLRIKEVPCNYDDILKYAKFRNPVNHVTVCFRKSEIISVGSYESLLLVEDYYLWVRLLIGNKKIENMSDILVYVRIGNGFHKRRGDKTLISSWKKLQNYLYNEKFINLFQKYRNIAGIYTMVYVPSGIKKFIYDKFLRKK